MKKSVSLTLFLLFFFSYAYFYPGGGHNEASRLDVIRALINDQSFIVDKYAYNSADLIKIDGHYYGSKAPGSTFLGVPFFYAAEKVLSLTPWPAQIRDHFVCYWTGVFTVALPCALGMVVLYWLLLRFRATPRESIYCTLAIGLGSLFFPFATLFFSHAVTATLLLAGFYQLVVGGKRWRWICGGFFLGSAIMFEYTAAAAAGLIGLYCFWRYRREPRALAWIVAAGLVGLLPALIQNWVAFGNPFFLSYEAYAQSSDSTFAAHKKGFLGISLPFLHAADWKLFLGNLSEISIRPLRGLFIFNPILLLTLPGFYLVARRVWRRDYPYPSEAILAFTIFLAYWIINAGFGDSIVYWGGGASFGPRHIIPMLPFAALALLESLRDRSLRAWFVPLLCLSVFFCLMATAIEPRTPYAPNNALFAYYWPLFLKSDFATTATGVFSNAPIAAGTVAFNWAKLAGFAGRFQLIPLFVFWFLAARQLDRHLGGNRGFVYVTSVFTILVAGFQILASL
jgi:hypothetical protein